MGLKGYDRVKLRLRPLMMAGVLATIAAAHLPASSAAVAQPAPDQRVRTAQMSSPARNSAERRLETRIAELGRAFNGDVGSPARRRDRFAHRVDGNVLPQQT